MKKVLSMLLAVIMLSSAFTMIVSAETITANPTTSMVLIDGVEKSFEAYNINDNNYFKLRDIAYCLSATDKKFAIDWQAETNTAFLETDKEYTPVGGELVIGSDFVSKNAVLSNTNIVLNGKQVQAKAYLIDGNNYFKLRDLGTVLSFSVEWEQETQTVVVNTNIEEQKTSENENNTFVGRSVGGSVYTTFNRVSNYGMVSAVQQFNYKNEGIGYAYSENGKLYVILPDSELTITMSYPLLGDVLSDDNGNIYIVWGQENRTDNQEVNTMFVSKYTSNGILVKTVGSPGKTKMPNGGTQKPFSFGNCRSIIHDNILTVYYSHKMYNGHQSSARLQVDINSMEILPVSVDEMWFVPYSSHSFNQDVIWSNKINQLVYADHGDAYDRGIQISYDSGAKYVPFHFYLPSNASYNMNIVNETFARLGGIVETSKGLIIVGTSARTLGEEAKNEGQDLFVQLYKLEDSRFPENLKEMAIGGEIRTGVTSFDIHDTNDSGVESVTDYGVNWLTDINEENPDYTIYQPQVIQVNDKVIVLYVKGIREKQEIASVKYKYYYQILSADAEILQGETEIECPLNAMEQPIYVNGKVQWVYAYNGKIGLGTIEIK